MSEAAAGPFRELRALDRIAAAIDTTTDLIGRVVSWLTLATAVICFATVYLRYAMNVGLIWLQELYVWTHVGAITLGAGYVLMRGGFVRVDLAYARMRARAKAWVDLIGTLCFMLPFLAMLTVSGWSFFRLSYLMGESSQQETGLGALWVLKGTLLILVAALGLQGLGMIVRSMATILYGPRAATPAQETAPVEAL
jgi:TRAP-type mannitol/chloroaromatic compound transport system permease small subunit